MATPRGYSPDIEIVTKAREIAEQNGCEVKLRKIRKRLLEDADASVYRCVREHGLRA